MTKKTKKSNIKKKLIIADTPNSILQYPEVKSAAEIENTKNISISGILHITLRRGSILMLVTPSKAHCTNLTKF